MKMITKALEKKLPKLYATERQKQPIVHVHYFCPSNGWDWYITEFDGKDTMFGLVDGYDVELGYISLSELSSVKDRHGRPMVERDLYWTPKPLSEVRASIRGGL
jgi:hypothetical protein